MAAGLNASSSRSAEFKDPIQTPVQFVKGVGPHRATLLGKLGIETLEDVLLYLPRTHQDRRPQPIKNLAVGTKATIAGVITYVDIRQVGRLLGQARAVVKDADATIEAIWFKYLSYKYDVFSGIKKDILIDRRVLLYGSVDAGKLGPVLKVEDYEILEEGQTLADWNSIVPIYSVTEGIGDKWLRQLAARVVPENTRRLVDPVPQTIRTSHQLMSIDQAVASYHFPRSWTERDRARERLAFDEFFFLELALALSRKDRQQNEKGFTCVPTKVLLSPFRQKLGYEFTKAQARAINEIFRDMGRPAPMYRLLQGDVGSGKTIVALSAALLAIESKRQVAMLAPTEILAEQHFLTVSKYVDGLGVTPALLMGSTPAGDRKKIIEKLKSGKIDILIGTHAVLNQSVEFQRLGLTIIDEQHRFGVRQRAKLVNRSGQRSFEEGKLLDMSHPDVLVMTATPIPRTLALTLYGDLDVSVIDEMPGGRSPITTQCVLEAEAMAAIRRAAQQGQQVFVVFPLLDESLAMKKREGKEVRAAKQEFEKLKATFPDLSLGLLHGQMKGSEKKEIMDRFRKNEFSVLVATTVIEVGIDIPNATLIVIINPERFGLAQLHQLRGRVGRGSLPSKCLLVPNQAQESTRDRLDTFCALGDGFKLAEEDLKMRGPGEILGDAQHGLPFFKVGDIIHDAMLIAQARNASQQLVHGELSLTMNEFTLLNKTLQKRFGALIQLSRVG